MGLDGVQFNFAEDYAKNGKEVLAESAKALNKAGVTVPVAKPANNQKAEQKPEAEQKPIAGAEIENKKSEVYLKEARKLTNDEAIKKAEYEARVAFYRARMEYNKDWSHEDVAKYAKAYVKNNINKEKFNQTYVCYDKDEYERLSAKREEEFDKLVKQFRNDGLSKKQAKAKADSMLYKYEYLKEGALGLGGRPRKFVENHEELFFEKGKFSNEKYHEFVLNMANTINADNARAKKMGFTDINGGISTDAYNSYLEKAKAQVGGDEAKAKQLLEDLDIRDNGKPAMETNYELHLKESRDLLAAKLKYVDGMDDVTARKLRAVSRKSGMKTEADYSNLYKLVGAAALGYVGHLLTPGVNVSTASASHSASQAGAKAGEAVAGAAADAVAGANASAKVNPGSLFGIIGLAASDSGKRVDGIPKIPEEKPVPPAQIITITNEPEPECPTEVCPREIRTVKEEFCPYDVQKKGHKTELWSTIIPNVYRHEDGSKLDSKEARQVWLELKRKNGVNKNDYMMPDQIKLFTVVNGKKYNVDCNAEHKMTTITPESTNKRFTRGPEIIDSSEQGQDCNKRYIFKSRKAAEDWKATGVIPEGTKVVNQ